MSKYGYLLLGICFLDLFITALGIRIGFLKEANPLLGYYLSCWGLVGFVAGKLFLDIAGVSVFELSYKFNLIPEAKIKGYYKTVIFFYLVILIGGVLYGLSA